MNPTVPAFDQIVEPGGYAWWYLDAISDDGRYGLTLIAFIGSVFSPYYARSRHRGRADPLDHCAINLALYGPGSRWSMTERGRGSVHRSATTLAVGPSQMKAHAGGLDIDISEWAVPVPRRIRGRIRVRPEVCHNQTIDLEPGRRHFWTPVWPGAQVDVFLQHPDLRWSGQGYLDHNVGTEPLESRFESWSWSRAATQTGPVVLYDTRLLDGNAHSLALHFQDNGQRRQLSTPPSVTLPRSRWGMPRPTRSDNGRARIEDVWEDTPFYTRSKVTTHLLGAPVTAVHESLSLKRFASPWVQLMLPFRMPRKR